MTRRIGYIITPERVTLELCLQAIVDASERKRRRYDVKRVLQNITNYAKKLQLIILDGTYEPSPYKVCHIIDKGSKKHRVLHKPKFFPDQCVHHVAILLVKDRLLKRIDTYAIASIKGKGIHYGHKAIKSWLTKDKRHTKYCLKGDIKKCYESIKPDLVVLAFSRFIKDKKYLALIYKIAHSHESLPLGNYTSAWFENLILLEMDKLCHLNSSHYLRFVDDFILLGTNKRKLRRMALTLQNLLAKQGLKLKANWQVFPVASRGIDMLGYRFWPDRILLRKRNALHIEQAVRRWQKHKTPHRARVVLSAAGGVKWFSSRNFYIKYFKGLNRKELLNYANRNY